MTIKPSLSQLSRFVGNPDAYAQQLKDGSWRPVREPLTDAVLQDHLDLKRTVGTYIGHQAGVLGTIARTLCFDIDNDELLDAISITNAAADDLGIPLSCVGIEFSGKKGYHVWVVLQDYRPSSELRRVGRAVLALAETACEVYPKQDEVKDLGSLVKLPGGLHQVSGKHNDFLGGVPKPLPSARWQAALETLPEEQARRAPSESRFPCMTAIQEEGASEGSRNNQFYHLAAMLRRAGVSDDNVDLILRITNDKNGDPIEDVELETLLESSKTGGPICGQLPEDRKCGELCILARTAGLYTRPGQVRHAADGENVVLTLVERRGDVVEFAHDDLMKLKGVLNGS